LFDGETFDPALSTGITANLVSSLGKRTALEVEVADGGLIIYVPWQERNAGYYGLEVTGTCNSKKWATYADSLIHYTRATEMGVAEVTIDSDYYDITQVVGYRYSTSPINAVTATVDDQVGTPSVEYQYDGKNINFDFHNLKGQPFTYDDLTPQQKEELRGEQGATGVYDQTTQDFLTTLETTTGQSQTKTMTQKAITDEFERDRIVVDDEIQYSYGYSSKSYINASNVWATIASGTGSTLIPVEPGTIIYAKKGTYNFEVEFLTASTMSGTVNTYAGDGNRIGWKTEDAEFVVPNDAKYIYVRRNDDGHDTSPTLYIREKSMPLLLESKQNIADIQIVNGREQGIGNVDGCKLNKYNDVVTAEGWHMTDYIPCPSEATIALNFGTIESDTPSLAFYSQNKVYYGWYGCTSSTSGALHRVVTINNPNVSYIRVCYYGNDCFVTINGEIAWSSDNKGVKMTGKEYSTFLATAQRKEYSAMGTGSALGNINLGHLVTGARYMLVIDDTTPWDSYQASLGKNEGRINIAAYTGSTATKWHYYGYKSLPTPHVIDFVAVTNDVYNISFRATSNTIVKCSLIGKFEGQEEISLVKQAKYIGIDSGVLPAIGLLHYSDLHGDQQAANEILSAIARHGAYINDVISTGDMVRENADGSSTYPQGTTWWANCGLPEKSLFVLGNHDNATANATEYDQKEDSNAWDGKGIDYAVANYFLPYDSMFGDSYHRPEGKCYWYKDYTSQKVRLIGLDCMHRFDGIVDPTTGQQDGDYAGLKHLTTEQEEWLVERLNATLDNSNAAYGYSVIIACHYPLDDYSGDNMTWNESSHKFVCNQNDYGGRVINQKTNDVTNWHYYLGEALSLEAKFSLRNRVNDGYPNSPWPNYTKGSFNNFGEIVKAWMSNGGKFVAWLSGHVHGDGMYYPSAFPDILTIAINQAGSMSWNNIAAERSMSYNRCVANYYGIDTTHGLLKIVRIGMKDQRLLIPTTYFTYDYINKKVISEG
jgi:hypothetical protein